MEKQTFVLDKNNKGVKQVWPALYSMALQMVQEGVVYVTLSHQRRSLDQNSKLWPMLTDISRQVDWPVQDLINGRMQWDHKKLTKEDWKNIFTASLKGFKTTQGIDGGVVALGQSTSRMNKREFSDLIELIYAFGNEKGVNWSERAIADYQAYREAA